MEVNLSIKGVPEAIAERLRLRAQRHHRSLQGELMAIVERAALEGVGEERPTETVRPAPPRSGGGREVIVRRGTKGIAEVAAELRALFPEPRSDLPRATDILRELRDSR